MRRSKKDQWDEIEKQDVTAKQICNLLVGTRLERRCDIRRNSDGWSITFNALSEAETRQIAAAIAVGMSAGR